MEWFYHLFGQHSPRERERAGYLKRIEHLNENILKLAGERNSAQEDCRALQKQLDTLSKDNLMLIDRMHGIEAERDGLREQVAVYLHANTSEIKQSRTRKKPLARTE